MEGTARKRGQAVGERERWAEAGSVKESVDGGQNLVLFLVAWRALEGLWLRHMDGKLEALSELGRIHMRDKEVVTVCADR